MFCFFFFLQFQYTREPYNLSFKIDSNSPRVFICEERCFLCVVLAFNCSALFHFYGNEKANKLEHQLWPKPFITLHQSWTTQSRVWKAGNFFCQVLNEKSPLKQWRLWDNIFTLFSFFFIHMTLLHQCYACIIVLFIVVEDVHSQSHSN